MSYSFYTIMHRLSRLLLEGLLKFPVHRCPKSLQVHGLNAYKDKKCKEKQVSFPAYW